MFYCSATCTVCRFHTEYIISLFLNHNCLRKSVQFWGCALQLKFALIIQKVIAERNKGRTGWSSKNGLRKFIPSYCSFLPHFPAAFSFLPSEYLHYSSIKSQFENLLIPLSVESHFSLSAAPLIFLFSSVFHDYSKVPSFISV